MKLVICIALISVSASFNANADIPKYGQSIGSGHPGMKVVTGKSGSVAIYRDEPQTFGQSLMGGMKDRKIQVIVDVGYHFDQAFMQIPEQLFPFDLETVFSNSGGAWTPDFSRWDYSHRKYVGYRFTNGQLTSIADVQKEAANKYHLSHEDVFLGLVSNKVFFWKNFDPLRVYWRDQSISTTYCLILPKGVIDIYGAASGIKKDIALSAFSKSRGVFHYSPYTTEVIEFNLTEGTECSPKAS